jgi:hypothetical protein
MTAKKRADLHVLGETLRIHLSGDETRGDEVVALGARYGLEILPPE